MTKDTLKKANKLSTEIEDVHKLLSKLKETEISGIYSIQINTGVVSLGESNFNKTYAIQNGAQQNYYTEIPEIKVLRDVFVQQCISVIERKLKALEKQFEELKEL